MVEEVQDIKHIPEFKEGDYVEIYSGTYEGHHFTIKQIRYNYDTYSSGPCFEYLYSGMLHSMWVCEDCLVKAR